SSASNIIVNLRDHNCNFSKTNCRLQFSFIDQVHYRKLEAAAVIGDVLHIVPPLQLSPTSSRLFWS
ncbi:hypothetical protein LINPERHAP1_LOCUS40622, partial [Linum perenne]